MCFMEPLTLTTSLILFILVLPTLLQDITGMADKWGSDGENGRIDPFVEIFEVSISLATRFSVSRPEFSCPARPSYDRPYCHMS